jgi:hypothetical protein
LLPFAAQFDIEAVDVEDSLHSYRSVSVSQEVKENQEQGESDDDTNSECFAYGFER